jgi:hypothetical protein
MFQKKKVLLVSVTDYKKNVVVNLFQMRSIICKNASVKYLENRYLITINGEVKHRLSSLEKCKDVIDKYFYTS